MPDEASSVLTIDLGAIAANYRLLQQRTDPALCGAAVKANAYGLGRHGGADAAPGGLQAFLRGDPGRSAGAEAAAADCDGLRDERAAGGLRRATSLPPSLFRC